MATLSVIRRWALRERLSIREIARRTGLSRNTIRKYLRSGDKEPSYAKRESVSRLDPFADKLAQWLKTESGKNRKQRRTLKQMHAELMELGFDGSYICEHRRVIERRHDTIGQTIFDWRHYLAVLQRKPGALRNGAPFTELPQAFKRLQAELLKKPGGDREMVDVLALVLHHEEQAVLAAVELALEVGVPTKMYVLNVLHRLLDGKAEPPPVDAPHALRLVTEPQANVNRYDELREERKARHA